MFPRSLSVFVSYSHEDRDVVVPVVALLRAMHRHVFLDVQSITPGSLWSETSSARFAGRTSS
jgi:hypothetical protein